MGLMGLAEGIEACVGDLLHTRTDLFRGEGVAVAQEMFILTGAIDEGGLPVQEELPPPLDVTDAKGSAHLISCLSVTLDHRGEGIEIWVVQAPALNILYLFRVAYHNGFTCLDGYWCGMSEHLFACGFCKLIHHLYLLRLEGVVFYFCINKHGVTSGIIPYVHPERLYAHSIGLNERYGTKDSEGLTALRKSPFAATSSTNPW